MNSWLEGICGAVLIVGSAGVAFMVVAANGMSDAVSEPFQGKSVLIASGAAALLGGFLILGAIRG